MVETETAMVPDPNYLRAKTAVAPS